MKDFIFLAKNGTVIDQKLLFSNPVEPDFMTLCIFDSILRWLKKVEIKFYAFILMYTLKFLILK